MNEEEIDMNNSSHIVDMVIRDLGHFRKISHFLIMKKFGLDEDLSKIICQKVWLKQHLEARELAKGFMYE